MRKTKFEMGRLQNENRGLYKKLKDNKRHVDKIADNNLLFHKEKSAVRHRELEYLTKREFREFHAKLREAIEMLIKMEKEAFKRDAKIV